MRKPSTVTDDRVRGWVGVRTVRQGPRERGGWGRTVGPRPSSQLPVERRENVLILIVSLHYPMYILVIRAKKNNNQWS